MSDPLLTRAVSLTPSAVDPSTAPAATDPAKLKDLASQFEGLLLSQMMRDLKMSFGGDEDSSSQEMAPLGDAMLSELGLALSRAGGFGLGDVLSRSLTARAGDAPAAASSTTDVTVADAAAPAAPNAVPVDAAPSAPVAAPAPATNARISSQFGWRSDPINGETRFHKGMDIAVREGSSVYAPAEGKVVSVGDQAGYGLTVVVQHANGYQSRYAHLSSSNVQAGQTVSAGDVLARSGNTGRSTGAHLHLEVLENGNALNPENWVDSVVRDQR